MLLLFFSEVHFYFHREINDNFFVNTTMASTIKASFDLSFPDLPCGSLTLDVSDETGAPQPQAVHEVFKQRISPGGKGVTAPERHFIGDALKKESDVEDLAALHFKHLASMKETAAQYGSNCGNCYGAGHAGECCNTCADVEKAYERYGWRFHKQGIAQCHFEALKESEEDAAAEVGGCRIYGELFLSKANGNFHIVPHKSIQNKGLKGGLENLLELLSFTFDQVPSTTRSASYHTALCALHPAYTGGGDDLY